jgi:hypothetical protein
MPLAAISILFLRLREFNLGGHFDDFARCQIVMCPIDILDVTGGGNYVDFK